VFKFATELGGHGCAAACAERPPKRFGLGAGDDPSALDLPGSSDMKADQAHQLDRVALGHDAVAQPIVETHFAVLDIILKMNVANQGA
jgi:hypothetical protein